VFLWDPALAGFVPGTRFAAVFALPLIRLKPDPAKTVPGTPIPCTSELTHELT